VLAGPIVSQENACRTEGVTDHGRLRSRIQETTEAHALPEGEIGHPTGKRKPTANIVTALERTLGALITVKQQGETRTVTRLGVRIRSRTPKNLRLFEGRAS